MSRAYFRDDIVNQEGQPAANATVRVRQPGTTNPIADTIYAGDTGGTTLSQPLTAAANGRVLFYLDTPQRVDLFIQAAGMADVTIPNVPIMPAPGDLVSVAGTQTLSNKTLSSPAINSPSVSGGAFSGPAITNPAISGGSLTGTAIVTPSLTGPASVLANSTSYGLTLRNGQTDGKALDIRTPDNSAHLVTVNRYGMAIGPAECIDGNLLAVTGSGTDLYKQLLTVEYNNTAASGGDISGIRAVIRDVLTGDSQLHATESHIIAESGGAGGHQRSAMTLTGNYKNASLTGTENNILRILSTPAAWGVLGAAPVDSAIAIQAGDGVINHFFRAWNELGALCFDLDRDGVLMAKGAVYSSGVGAHRVGMLAPGGATGGQTWAGMYYDPTSDRLVVEAFEHGAGWRDTWVGASGGTLRIGTAGEPVWKAPQLAASSSNLTLNAAPTVDDIPGCSISLGIGVWAITGTVMGLCIGAGDAGQGLVCIISTSAGTLVDSGSAIQLVGAQNDVMMGSQQWKLTVASGTATVKLRGYKSGGTGASRFDSPHCVISARYCGNP